MKEQPAGEDGVKKPAQPFLLHRESSAGTVLDWSGQVERVAGADRCDLGVGWRYRYYPGDQQGR